MAEPAVRYLSQYAGTEVEPLDVANDMFCAIYEGSKDVIEFTRKRMLVTRWVYVLFDDKSFVREAFDLWDELYYR